MMRAIFIRILLHDLYHIPGERKFVHLSNGGMCTVRVVSVCTDV